MNSIIWPSWVSDSIPQALDPVESLIGAKSLDVIEDSFDDVQIFCLRLAGPMAMLSYFFPFTGATLFISSLGLFFLSRKDYVQAKKALVEMKICQILSDSAAKPKKALIIQSPKDEYKALAMRSHIEKVKRLAATHAIERVIVKNEREFLASLPPGRFDIVWIRAHGTPTSIEMGPKFRLTKNCRPEIFHALASKVKQHGKLILECCRVAEVKDAEGNIAEHIASYCWDTTVYAPLTKISGIFGLEFDKWGYPQFNDGFSYKGRSVTRVIEGPES